MAPLLWLVAAASAHVPVVYITDPGEDWCAVIAQALGGDIIMLEPGTYTGPCRIEAIPSDLPGEQTTVQSLDPADPAVLTTSGDHVLSVLGERLVLLQLRFEDLGPGVDAVRVVGPMEELFVRYSWFENLEGSLLTFTVDVGEVSFEDNQLTNVTAPVTLGCPDGSCRVGEVVVHENLWVDSGGLVITPGAVGEMRDNVMVGAPEVGLRLGPSDPSGRLLIERNLFEGTRGVQIDGGPALFRNNVVIGSTTGLSSTAPAARDVSVVGNTILGGAGAALDLSGWGAARELRLVSNALDQDVPTLSGVELAGNVGCPDADLCFTDATSWDVYPAPGSPLRGGAVADADLLGDWCGRARLDPPSAGALEAFGDTSMGPLQPVFKDDFDCTLPEDPPDTGDTDPPVTTPEDTAPPTDTDDTTSDTDGTAQPADDDDKGCGCASSTGGPMGLVALLGLALWTRRRRSVAAAVGAGLALGLAPAAEAHQSTVWILEPGDDYCTFLQQGITPGDLVKLAPGEYPGPCEIVGLVPPEAGELTVLESLDPSDPAVIRGDGVTPYVLSVEGQDVWINLLVIDGVAPGGSAVELRGGDDLQVRNLDVRSDGDGIRVTGDATLVQLANNRLDVAGDAVVVGCDDGSCGVDGLQVRDNLVVASVRGIVVHDADGVVADNVVVSDGAALQLAGTVEVAGTWARGTPALEVLDAGVVAHTLLLEGEVRSTEAFSLQASTVLGDLTVSDTAALVSNLVLGELPTVFEGVDGNASCSSSQDCWVAADTADFRPVDGAPTGLAIDGLDLDFCGIARQAPPVAGAFAPTDESWDLVVDFKEKQDCGRPVLDRPDPSDDPPTTEPSTTDGTPVDVAPDEADTGCGCVSGVGGASHWIGLIALLAVNRRHRRDTTVLPNRVPGTLRGATDPRGSTYSTSPRDP